MFNDATILITGGSGSFGQEAVKTILANYKPKKVIVFSRDEYKQYLMAEKWPDGPYPIRYFIGDVRDKERMWRAFEDVDYVIHAAALKQVPTCEYNPIEAIKTNVIGAQNVIECAIGWKVKKVIALGTDKQVNPINLYGATKLCAEKLFIAANAYSGGRTKFSVVRYGNVMASRGSVVPYFQQLAKEGKPIPITDPRMTRFWMTLHEAAVFVIDSIVRMSGAEVIVPTLPSVLITDVAQAIAGVGCPVAITGVRPGEKLHETLISQDEDRNVRQHAEYFVIIDRVWNGISPFDVPPNFSYTSENNQDWLTIPQIREIISKNAAS